MSRVQDIPTSRLQNYFDFNRDTLSFLVKMLPLGDVVSLRTGFKPSFIVNSPEFIQEILVAKETYFRKGRTTDVLRRTIGDGLLTAESGEHSRQKKYMQPTFYKERLQRYAEIMVEETEKAIKQFHSKNVCNLQDEMMQLTLTIIAKTMFATDLESEKKELAMAVSDTIEQSARTLFKPVLLPLAIPTKGNRIHKKAIHKLESMIYRVIGEAKQHPDRYQMTLLGLLLDTVHESGEPISEQEVRDQLMTMLLAGHETTANLLTWIFYALSRNPEVEQKFHQEIDQQKELATSPLEAYRSLPYTQQIIQEALRLYPPAWLIYREANQDVELLGESFKKGSTFMISPYAIHRNEAIFPDPDSFVPERFDDNNMGGWPKFSYFPFGGGSRSCIGSRFALMEAAILLATIGQHYRFLPVVDTPVVPEPVVSLRIKGGLMTKVVHRTEIFSASKQ
jgi:cytochrome P450